MGLHRPEFHHPHRTKKQIAVDTNTKMDSFLDGYKPPVVKKIERFSGVPMRSGSLSTSYVLTHDGMQANLGKLPKAMSAHNRKIIELIAGGNTSAEMIAKKLDMNIVTIMVELTFLQKEGLIS